MNCQFWKSFQNGLGTRIKFSMTFHPQIDGQAKCTIQTLEDMLRASVIEFKGNWDDHLPLIEFGLELVHEAMEKVRLIRERLKTTRQKSYADVRKRDLECDVDDWVYLKISPMKGVMRFGKKEKLSPCYVAHIKFRGVLKCVGDPISIVPLENLGTKKSLSYEEVTVEILDRHVWKLRNKEVTSVKVLWMN
ncbi:hypothetical protein MTR67_026774 [Solanum verrucosum]|uniref:Uncharacterized protein n=1 Tax=Solanum verrucosum TaxID=315347 RepID=A0AAF0QZK0_SOLVR|nr:hypothetical protein MTR67_026774 [Solanum verrucosum]